MIKFSAKELECLEKEIYSEEADTKSPMELAETLIPKILKTLKNIKLYLESKGFRNDAEEIHFFKKIKPLIVSKLIYYNALYKIEIKRPYYSKKSIKRYLNEELHKLKKYFDNNREFYKYHRTNSTYLDNKYFIRGNIDIKLSLDTNYFESDHTFCTSHDYKAAKIIANDLIQVYLEDQLFKISKAKRVVDNHSVTWTGSKTALTELIYALHAEGALDNGNADIKAIAKTFEIIFNIDLGDFYHTFMELKSRKLNRTKFIDSLKESLLKKMDEEDEM